MFPERGITAIWEKEKEKEKLTLLKHVIYEPIVVIYSFLVHLASTI